MLGAGGMGEVCEARDARLDRTVAIKILPAELAADPDRRARFEREARAIAALSHPHICTLFDIGASAPSHSGNVTPACLRITASSPTPMSPRWGFGMATTSSPRTMNSWRPPENGPVKPSGSVQR